ncbi:MAG: hypothetical protein AAGG08_00935 [Actinomycetota bacterium]
MSDEFLDPDEILDPDDPRSSGTSGFDLGDLDHLADRAVASVMHLVRRANALAGGVLMFTVLAAAIGFSLGLVALSDGIRTVWIVVAGFFAVVGIGGVVVSMWRLRSVRRSADHLVGEVRSLISNDRANEQVVVETVQQTGERSDGSVVELSRGFFDMRSMVTGRVDDVRHVASAVQAVTTFPGFMALATLIGVVFLGFGVLFLIALAL